MSAHLWFQILTAIFVGWIGLTLYVVWRATGDYFPGLRHQYFWRWVFCGILTDTPLLNLFAARIRIPAGGVWYPLPQLTEWMDGRQVYHLSFSAWFIHYGLRTAILPVGLAVCAFGWRVRHHLDTEHLCGLRLLTPRDHNRQLNGGYLTRWLHRHRGIRLGSSIIPEAREPEHFLVTGSPGAGKSTLMRHMLTQIADRGQSAILIDPDCEFVQEFYEETRGDVVLNPLDARCPFAAEKTPSHYSRFQNTYIEGRCMKSTIGAN
jgi:hypothetical protein